MATRNKTTPTMFTILNLFLSRDLFSGLRPQTKEFHLLPTRPQQEPPPPPPHLPPHRHAGGTLYEGSTHGVTRSGWWTTWKKFFSRKTGNQEGLRLRKPTPGPAAWPGRKDLGCLWAQPRAPLVNDTLKVSNSLQMSNLHGCNYFIFACLALKLNKVYSHSSLNLTEAGSNGAADPTKKPHRSIWAHSLLLSFAFLAFAQFGYIFRPTKYSQRPRLPRLPR